MKVEINVEKKESELGMDEFMRLKQSFKEFARKTIALDTMEEPVEMRIKVPAKIKWLAETAATHLEGKTLSQLVTDALTEYLTKKDED